jgi:hypothetical protein
MGYPACGIAEIKGWSQTQISQKTQNSPESKIHKKFREHDIRNKKGEFVAPFKLNPSA